MIDDITGDKKEEEIELLDWSKSPFGNTTSTSYPPYMRNLYNYYDLDSMRRHKNFVKYNHLEKIDCRCGSVLDVEYDIVHETDNWNTRELSVSYSSIFCPFCGIEWRHNGKTISVTGKLKGE